MLQADSVRLELISDIQNILFMCIDQTDLFYEKIPINFESYDIQQPEISDKNLTRMNVTRIFSKEHLNSRPYILHHNWICLYEIEHFGALAKGINWIYRGNHNMLPANHLLLGHGIKKDKIQNIGHIL